MYVFGAFFVKSLGVVWSFCILNYLAIYCQCPFVGFIVWIFGDRAEKNFEGSIYVSWHGNVDIFLVVISVNGQSALVLPFKFHGYFVIFFKSVQEMIRVGIRKVFDTKIIDAEKKHFLVAFH